MKIERNIVAPGIVSLRFENQYDTCATFMRLQEFYESPFKEIRGKFFTLEQFMDRYAKAEGNFTYTSDWGGFNVPGHVVLNFFQVFDVASNDLLEKEAALHDLLFEHMESGDNFYVIGHYGKSNELDLTKPDAIHSTLAHEVAHGTFYLNAKYKKAASALVNGLADKVRGRMTEKLLGMGYSKPVIKDEINAYLATSKAEWLKARFGLKLTRESKPFRELFLETAT